MTVAVDFLSQKWHFLSWQLNNILKIKKFECWIGNKRGFYYVVTKLISAFKIPTVKISFITFSVWTELNLWKYFFEVRNKILNLAGALCQKTTCFVNQVRCFAGNTDDWPEDESGIFLSGGDNFFRQTEERIEHSDDPAFVPIFDLVVLLNFAPQSRQQGWNEDLEFIF